jgi:hypothetical protein
VSPRAAVQMTSTSTLARLIVRLCCCYMVLVAAPKPAPAVGDVGTTTYVGTTITPRIANSLGAFLGHPLQAIVESQAKYEMGSLRTTEDFRRWTYTQVLSEEDTSLMGNQTSEINMVYAALADGTFISYYDSERYSFRGPGTAAPGTDDFDVSSSPQPRFLLSNVNTACGAAPTHCANPDWSPTRTMQASCVGNGEARVADGGFGGDLTGACTLTCCDRSIRTYYATGRQLRGVPQVLTKWSVYDPRQRPWYGQQVERMRSQHQPFGWSSVYEFSSGGLGITATGSICSTVPSAHQITPHDCGVFGIDYGLDDIEHLLALATTNTRAAGGTWAYIVERGQSSDGGLVVGSTSGEALTACVCLPLLLLPPM